MKDAHIVRAYDDELKRLQNLLFEMGGRCEAQLADAIRALETRDPELAATVVRQDMLVDALEMEIEGLVLRLFALRQPLAVDLRQVLSSLKMAAWLERVGDYAKNVAKRTIELLREPPAPPTRSVVELGRRVQAQLNTCLDAVAKMDLERAETVWRGDRELDELYLAASQETTTCMRANPDSVPACTQLAFIAKNLERIGDLATNIVEVLHFSVTGRRLTEPRPRGD